jgi:hypothetical protein
VEVREIMGVFIGGIIGLALLATAVNKDSQTAKVAEALTSGFANDIRAATFQNAPGTA